jgi:uncharacterized membrane protein
MLRSIAEKLGPRLGIAGVLGGALLDLVAIMAVVLVCLLAGLIARRASARRMRTKLVQAWLGSFPGYGFVKGLAESIQQSEENASSFLLVLMRFDDFWQVAFETDRTPGGTVAIYGPGAPNPWSGHVLFVTVDRVRRLPVSIPEALKVTRALGQGFETLVAGLRALEGAQSG